MTVWHSNSKKTTFELNKTWFRVFRKCERFNAYIIYNYRRSKKEWHIIQRPIDIVVPPIITEKDMLNFKLGSDFYIRNSQGKIIE